MADEEPALAGDGATSAIAALLEQRWSAQDEPEPAPQEEPKHSEPEPAPVTPEIPAEAAPEGEVPAAEPAQAEPTPAAVTAKAPEPSKPQDAPPKAAEPSPANQRLSDLNAAIPLIRAQIANEFPDIKNTDDLMKVAVEDPARALRYKLYSDKLQEVSYEQSQLTSQLRSQWEASERAKLVEALPELKDPVKGPALRERLVATAKSLGYSDDVIANASAADALMLHEVMQARDAKEQQAKDAAKLAESIKAANKKAANAPPVQKPGAQAPSDGSEKVKGLQERFQKSGHLNDLAAYLRESGIA